MLRKAAKNSDQTPGNIVLVAGMIVKVSEYLGTYNRGSYLRDSSFSLR